MTDPRDPRQPRRSFRTPAEAGRPAGPRGAGPPRGRQGPAHPAGTARPGPPGGVRRATAVRSDAYANLALPALLRGTAARPRRRVRHRTGLRHLPHPRAARRGHRAPRRAGRPTASTRCCWTCCGWVPTSCCAPGSSSTPRCPPPSSRPASNSIRREPVSSTACCAPSRGATSSPGWRELAPPATADPVGHAAFVHAHPRWIAQAFADALGAGAGELDALLASDDERPSVHLPPGPAC